MNADLGKILPWLSIRAKLIIAFVGLSVLPLTLVGLHGILSNISTMERIALENLTHDVHAVRENTASFLRSVETELRVLRNLSLLDRFTSSREKHDKILDRVLLDQLQEEFLAVMSTRKIYYQIRILDEDGDELLRIESTGTASSASGYRSVSDSELRQGRESFYFALIDGLDRNHIGLVPSELVDRNNVRIPVMSFAMPLIGSERRVGILVANVYAKDLFGAMETRRHLDVEGIVALVSKDGHYLYHSTKKTDWNKLLASREKDNLQHDYPGSIVSKILSGEEGTVLEGSNEIVSYAPLFPGMSTVQRDQYVPNFAVPLYVFESVPKNVIMAPVRSFAWEFATFLVFFLAIAIGLGLLATRQFTRPIAALQRGAETIAGGEYHHRLRVDTHDEIERLAEQFNLMATSLEVREKEIQRHRTQLEEMVRLRTSQLTEEKTKLQAIVDNVPSAFVLLDEECRIQTASAAFGEVTGLKWEDVKGKNCGDVFCKTGFCQQCVSRRAIQSGDTESHVDCVVGQTGSERFIEHIAIPMKTNGRVDSILEIITDVTKRKHFEQHLVRTERLAAAGEVSAIVAHEFRNALTSVKMILQLQNESGRQSRTDKKSLGVALSSVYHMERFVTGLLDFARPSPLVFRLERLDQIINESLAFVKLHMNNQRITLRTKMDASVPAVLLDAPSFKEALINLLLNSIQAIDGKTTRTRKEHVAVTVSKVRLRKTLHEFTDSRASSRWSRRDGNQTEILIPEGTPCVSIEVRDSGPGIPRSFIGRIFDPFFTTKIDGTGLGLPMVKRTVNAHGGITTVASKVGGGVAFRIYVPISNAT